MAERFTAVAANLLEIASARKSADPHSHPPKLGHQLCQTPARPGPSALLRNFEDIEHSCVVIRSMPSSPNHSSRTAIYWLSQCHPREGAAVNVQRCRSGTVWCVRVMSLEIRMSGAGRPNVQPCYLITLLRTEPTAVRAECAKAGRTGNVNQQR